MAIMYIFFNDYYAQGDVDKLNNRENAGVEFSFA